MSLRVEKIKDEGSLKEAFQIRKTVFVVEQKVDPDKECDEFEDSSTHFLALLEEKPVGAARWRFTKNGIKLERFAVLKEARGKGVGQALVRAALENISSHPESKGKTKYLNSQLNATTLYSKFGFQKVGVMFEECNIKHFKMELA
jgi:predicted GNAT family N-acyltransferase